MNQLLVQVALVFQIPIDTVPQIHKHMLLVVSQTHIQILITLQVVVLTLVMVDLVQEMVDQESLSLDMRLN